MGLSEVSNILWKERQLLELLLFKLETEQLILASGKSRFLAPATNEVELVIEQVKQAELERAVEVDVVAAEFGLPANPSLSELAGAVPAPWDRILEEHRKDFLAKTGEILLLAQANKELLSQGQKAARDALAWLGGMDTEVYKKNGSSSTTGTPRARLVNRTA